MKSNPPVEKRSYTAAHFLVALIALFAAAPFLDQLPNGYLVEAGLTTVVLLFAVFAVGSRPKTLGLAVALVIPAIATKWLSHFRPGLLPDGWAHGASIVFVSFVVVRLSYFIMCAPRVTSEVLCAGIANYLMLGVLWSIIYSLIAKLNPAAFQFSVAVDRARFADRFEALYFSFTTQTTVAFGDIIPVSNAAKVMAMSQATTGTLYMAVIIARLVALYSADKPAESP